jgi:hypothetical protein
LNLTEELARKEVPSIITGNELEPTGADEEERAEITGSGFRGITVQE